MGKSPLRYIFWYVILKFWDRSIITRAPSGGKVGVLAIKIAFTIVLKEKEGMAPQHCVITE